MILEKTPNGSLLVCGHIFPADQIQPGSVWQGSGGSRVTVERVDGEWVHYKWIEKGETKHHRKLVFAFQCRYCLEVDEDFKLTDT